MDGSRRDGTKSKNVFYSSESCSSVLAQLAGDIVIDT